MALPLSYNWRNLFVRKTTTLLTCLVIATVVGVFTWLVGFAGALNRSLSYANDAHKLIVLKQGATSETNSAILPEDYNKLSQVQDVAVNPKTGEPLRSPEMIVQVSLPRRRDNGTTFANVAVRGVTDAAFGVHRNVKLLGKGFSSGSMEVIVGEQAAKQFGGVQIGDTINLGYSGNRGYKVVGYFSANGGPMETEIWGPLTTLMNSYNRNMYSSVNVLLNDKADPDKVAKFVQGPSVDLNAQTEPAYWYDQSKNIRIYLGIVGGLVSIMCVAAIFAIANTMYATVAGRTREFAMLRTIGFSKNQILLSVVIEAVFLALLGGAMGCIACEAWLVLAGNTKDMFGATTFTTMAFEIKLTPYMVVGALLLVAGVAVLGALPPAVRASRVHVIDALREP